MDYLDSIDNDINNEDTGLWFIEGKDFQKIVLKAPTNTLKAIYKGCKIEMYFKVYNDVDSSYLIVGTTIYDFQDNALNVFGLNRYKDEYLAIKNFFKEDKIYFEFCNELGIVVFNCYINLSEPVKQNVTTLIDSRNDFYVGHFSPNADSILDKFQNNISNNNLDSDVIFNCNFSEFTTIKSMFIRNNEYQKIVLDDDEGKGFEKQIWATLQGIFSENLFINPELIENNKKREFVDILAFYQHGLFLIEAKAMGVLVNLKESNIDRKVLNLHKQIRKAVKQLTGAKKALEKDYKIFSVDGNEITFDRKQYPHCIILISELIPFGDWQELEKEILATSVKENIIFHIIDLLELMKFVKYANSRAEVFDYLFVKRADEYAKNGFKINLRAKIGNTEIN